MTQRAAWVFAAFFALVPFSGCLDTIVSPTFHIPEPTLGERWSRTISVDTADPRGNPVHLKARQDFAIDDRVQTVPDRFGYPVSAVGLLTTYTDEATGDRVEFANAIETKGGNWLFQSQVPYEWRYDVQATLLGQPLGRCENNLTQPGPPSYAQQRVPFGQGNLWGRSIRTGDRFFEEGHVMTDSGPVPAQTTYAVGPKTTIRSGLSGRSEDVLPVEADTAIRGLDPVTGLVSEFHTFGTFYMAAGVAHPLVFSAESRTMKVRLELTRYEPGELRVPIEGLPPLAHFEGVHPEASFIAAPFAPDTTTLGLAYTLDEAFATIANDPRTRDAADWIRSKKPTAIVWQASYLRDDTNQSYRWTLVLTDGRDVVEVNATRTLGPAGLPLDEARERGVRRPREPLPSPGWFSTLQLVKLPFAVQVASMFLPEKTEWKVLEWKYDGAKALGKWARPATLFYSLGDGAEEVGDLPLAAHRHFWRAAVRTIDGSHGGLVTQSSERLDCSYGVRLGPF